jgi:hypothetical protein
MYKNKLLLIYSIILWIVISGFHAPSLNKIKIEGKYKLIANEIKGASAFTEMELNIKKNHSYSFEIHSHVMGSICESGKWAISEDTLILNTISLYDCFENGTETPLDSTKKYLIKKKKLSSIENDGDGYCLKKK